MAGYECSKPSTLPTASNLDLKHTSNGIKTKLSTVSKMFVSQQNKDDVLAIVFLHWIFHSARTQNF